MKAYKPEIKPRRVKKKNVKKQTEKAKYDILKYFQFSTYSWFDEQGEQENIGKRKQTIRNWKIKR